MPDENNPEITSFPDASSVPTRPPTVEDLLRDPQHGITTLREFVEAASTAITVFKENQRLAVTAASDCQAKASEIANAATQAVAAMTQITDAQAVIATKSDHIQKAQEHADKVRADLDRVSFPRFSNHGAQKISKTFWAC